MHLMFFPFSDESPLLNPVQGHNSVLAGLATADDNTFVTDRAPMEDIHDDRLPPTSTRANKKIKPTSDAQTR